jgi:subtilisin-like proprotein convertase family protein
MIPFVLNTNSAARYRACVAALLAFALSFALNSSAALYNFSVNSVIPDGDASGYVNQQTVSGLLWETVQVNVGINISGGYNGDLYGYIQHNGTTVLLLNQVGTSGTDSFGYANTGFNVTLSDSATQIPTIHFYQDTSYSVNGSGQLTGTWRPDSGSLSAFKGMDPNGTWTLFFADISSGEQSTLVSWSLDITAVPEPTTIALGVFLAGAGTVSLYRWRRKLGRLNSAL